MSVPPSSRPRVGQRGLTIVELMLALVVVGVLASTSVNAWSGWRERVRVKQAQDDIIALSAVIDARWQDTQTLPADLAAIGRGGMRDPWGRPYRYLALTTPASKGAARKDKSLVPLNTDYDLYSMGADGKSAAPLTAKDSRDDILRANNGRYIGPAVKY